MSEHTQGPWFHYDDSDRSIPRHTVVASGKTISNVYCTKGDEKADQANARLIAAAPDFFDHAKSLIEAWDARTTGAQQIVTGKSDRELQQQAMEAIEGLRQAISKATNPQHKAKA